MELSLTPADRLVFLQFSFSNEQLVPAGLKRAPEEGLDSRVRRKSPPARGQAIIEPIEGMNVSPLTFTLLGRYLLVDAWWQRRLKRQDIAARSRSVGSYAAIRFVYCRIPEVSHLSIRMEDMFEVMQGLSGLAGNSLWRVRAFRNPDISHPGRNVISVNLEARQPLFKPTGGRIKVWDRDEAGRKVGVSPKPLVAADTLVLA